MKVLFDHQVFGFQKYGGISRYFTELLKRFRQYPEMDSELSLWFSENHYLGQLEGSRVGNFFDGWQFKGKRRVVEAFNRWHSRKCLKVKSFDIFHPTYYHPYFLSGLKGRPFILTIHDMIHELLPDGFNPKNKVSEYKRLLAGKASRIIAVSANTKSDIIRLYGTDPERIEVIHHGLSMPASGDKADLDPVLPPRFLLFTGDRKGYKNFEPFVRDSTRVFKDDPDLHLVCVGGGGFTARERQVLSDAGLERRTLLYSPTDSELAFIYTRAQAFAYPSLYEGFGIPILEAFAAGCPLLLSRASCFPEIAQDGAQYFEPGDAASLDAALRRILYDGKARATLAAAGKKRLGSFSWDQTAQRTKALYSSLI